MTDIKIGPSFGDELHAAGLAGLPLSWRADGTITYGDAITAKQKKAVEAVLAKHDPAATPRSERIARLAALDTFIPRGLEDQWAATGFDTTALPQIQQDRLAEKAALRAAL